MTPIIIAVVLASSISFLCSLMEAALYSVPMGRIQAMVDRKVGGAALLLRLRERVDLPISAILTFNTIANTIGGIISGVLVGEYFGSESPVTLIAFPIFFTMVILILSEIIPKTLGVIYADTIAPKAAPLIQGLIYVLYPFVMMSQYMTGRIRASAEEKKTVSEDELISQARLGVEEGVLLPEEAQWVENALRLNDKTAHELMTPRTVVYTLPSELPMSMVTAHSEHWTHSRLPLCLDRNPDKVVGLVYRRDVFDTLLTKTDEELARMRISELMHPVDFIPETMRGNEILRRFLQARQHLFIVSNEHGGMEGIITLEDVIEALLGTEIVDYHDQHEDMQEYARKLAEKRRQFLSGATRTPPT